MSANAPDLGPASMFFSPPTNAALAVALLGASCSTSPKSHAEAAAPHAFVAWICADAARAEFAGADPLPYHGMAPATRHEDGSFEVRYEQRADGRWAPRAAGRVLATLPADVSLPATNDYATTTGLDGWRAPEHAFVVHIGAGPRGAQLHCEAEGPVAEAAARHVLASARFAQQLADARCEEPEPCCAGHAPWRAHARLRTALRAQQEGDLIAARAALSRARADAPQSQRIEQAIAMLDVAIGQDELAAASLAAASRNADDPSLRATMHRESRSALRRHETNDGDALRAEALARAAGGEIARAKALALAARAKQPDPVTDLLLRHRLQNAERDVRGAIGTALLLREYGAGWEADRLLAAALEESGQSHLAERATTRVSVAMRAQRAADLRSATARALIAEAMQKLDAASPATPPR